MLCEPMAEITRKYKATYEGVEFMCKAVEEFVKKERENAILDSIKKVIQDGELSHESVARIFGISLEEVEKIAATC